MQTIKSLNTRVKLVLLSVPISVAINLYFGISFLIHINLVAPFPWPEFFQKMELIGVINFIEICFIFCMYYVGYKPKVN